MNKNTINISISQIDSFEKHPFKVIDDESLNELVRSIKDNGLINPLIVRKKENSRYELISGHRRKMALEKLNIKSVDVIVKDLDDDDAIIYMVDSNIYREKILPSEKAFAYKMKLDAMKHQGTSCHNGTKLRTTEDIGKEQNDSARQVSRYIRLTKLIPELLKLVDDGCILDKRTNLTMGLLPAVELSFLTIEEQKLIYKIITYEEIIPSHGQARQIKELGKKKKMTFDSIEKILLQNKGNQNERISFNKEKIENVLPQELKGRDKRYIEEYIIKAIKEYKNKSNTGNSIDYDINYLKI